jgi:hypothetical protein
MGGAIWCSPDDGTNCKLESSSQKEDDELKDFLSKNASKLPEKIKMLIESRQKNILANEAIF